MNKHGILQLAMLLTLIGCEGQVESPPPEPAADTSAPETGAQAAGNVHFINERQIGNGDGPVTAVDLLQGAADPGQWVLYGGDYANFRHSPISVFTPETVGRLQVAWSFPTGTPEQFEVSPVIYDGIMYVTSSNNRLFALDAISGELYWRYDHPWQHWTPVCSRSTG
jgi:glucose dehydrogenase